MDLDLVEEERNLKDLDHRAVFKFMMNRMNKLIVKYPTFKYLDRDKWNMVDPAPVLPESEASCFDSLEISEQIGSDRY